jgi:outer membrane protein OmpA-like peptidoglycan-associated protein
MKTISSFKTPLVFCLLFVFTTTLFAQTKRLKRPNSRVGIYSVDKFVKESFDLYDKVYIYDGYAAAGKSLDDDALEMLTDALEDVTELSETAPDVLSDLDGQGALKQAKATLQINRAKKAIKYSIKTAKELLAGREKQEDITKETPQENSNSGNQNSSSENSSSSTTNQENSSDKKDIQVYSKFDFVPGDKVLFFDDFRNDFIGDFPSKWNTNGSGEVVTVGDSPQKWLGVLPGYNTFYIPDVTLPEEYTIEFDLLAVGLDRQTSSTAVLQVKLSDNKGFTHGDNYFHVNIPFCQYSAIGFRVRNYIRRGASTDMNINNVVNADIREAVLNKPHISIAVNKQRFRLWVNEKKYVDIPRAIPENVLNTLKFELNNFKDGKERLFISNLKVAEGGVDLRRKLMSEGKISTTGILFDSGSANIQPQSMGIIRQIYQVLQQDASINLKIIGHTDADGNDDNNLTLSQKRADAVKNAFVSVYGVSANRLQTEGKGETMPVGDNNTPDGKAQNRRVEFIKM